MCFTMPLTNRIKRREELHRKFEQLKTECESVVQYADQVIEIALKIVNKQDAIIDQVEYFRNFPIACKELDKLTNTIIQLNCTLESVKSEDEESSFHSAYSNNCVEIGANSIVRSETKPDLEYQPILRNSSFEDFVSCVSRTVCSSSLSLFTQVENNDVEHATAPPVFPTNNNYIPPLLLKAGSIVEMAFSQGASPWNFWLHSYSTKSIDSLRNQMLMKHQHNELRSLTSLPVIGDYVSSLDGSLFYRGKVLHCDNNDQTRLIVLDVDTGITRNADLKYTWHLHEDISCLPAQAINCKLKGNLGDCKNWHKELTHVFKSALRDCVLVVTICDIVENRESVQFIVEIDSHDDRLEVKVDVKEWVLNTVIPHLDVLKQAESAPDRFQAVIDSLNPISLYRNEDSVNLVGEQLPVLHLKSEEQSDLSSSFHSQENELCLSDTDIVQRKNSQGHLSSEMSCKDSGDHTKINNCAQPVFTPIGISLQDHYEAVLANSSSVDLNLSLDYAETNGKQLHEETLHKVCQKEKNPSLTNKKGTKTILKSRALDCQSSKSVSHVMLLKKDYSKLVDRMYNVLPSHIATPGEFYVHILCDDISHIDELKSNMCDYYSDNNKVLPSKEVAKKCIGKYCACLYPEDNMWYRAEVLDWMDDSADHTDLVHVLYVDYGNKLQVTVRMMQPLITAFANFPIFAQFCHLAYIGPPDSSSIWPQQSIDAFLTLVSGPDCKITIVESLGNKLDSLPVVIKNSHLLGEDSINSYLKDIGLAIELGDMSLETWNPMKEDFCSPNNMLAYNDEDACMAVSGYAPKDEKRICKFFAQKGNCFKGDACRREHALIHPDGWTSDKEFVYQDAFRKLNVPDGGRTVMIYVTEVVSVNVFYGHILEIVQPSFLSLIPEEEQEETLLTLQNFMNSATNIKTLRRSLVTPAIGQLVVARFAYDRQWYRARVIETCNDTGSLEVFFVDYGNKETVRETDICEIKPQYLHLPFQAVECFIANVSSKDDIECSEAIDFVKKLILNKEMKAEIISKQESMGQMEVILRGQDDVDIGSLIVEKQFGVSKAYTPYSSEINFIPG